MLSVKAAGLTEAVRAIVHLINPLFNCPYERDELESESSCS